MTSRQEVSVAEATAAARRIHQGRHSLLSRRAQEAFVADARLLAGFVLAGSRIPVVYIVDEVEWVDSVWSTPELAQKRLKEHGGAGITAWTVDGGPEAEREIHHES